MARETQKTLKITTNHVTVKKERWPIIPLGGDIGTDGQEQDQAQPSVSNDLHEPQQAKLVRKTYLRMAIQRNSPRI